MGIFKSFVMHHRNVRIVRKALQFLLAKNKGETGYSNIITDLYAPDKFDYKHRARKTTPHFFKNQSIGNSDQHCSGASGQRLKKS